MNLFLLALIIALVISAIGFKKYVWFISLGYGFSIAGIGLMVLILKGKGLAIELILYLALFLIYGLRLGGYLAIREIKSASYNSVMKKEIKSGKDMPFVAKCGIWIAAALLYACEVSPVLFRIVNHSSMNVLLIIGLIISALGLIIESTADLQKNAAKKEEPSPFRRYWALQNSSLSELLWRNALLDRSFCFRHHDLFWFPAVACCSFRIYRYHLCHVRRRKKA